MRTGSILEQHCKRLEKKAYAATCKAVLRFKRGDYFDSLRSFSKAINMFNVPSLSTGLKRSKERLFNHILDCLLCSALCYIELSQSFDIVTGIIDQILLIEPHNIEALFLRWLSYLKQGQALNASVDESLLVRILQSKGLKLPSSVGQFKRNGLSLKMRADSFVEIDSQQINH